MKLIAKTLFGLEKVLSDELRSLGAVNIAIANRAVIFEGNTGMLYRANYCTRTALSVLMQVKEFRIRTKEDLYTTCKSIQWENFMHSKSTFSITAVVNSPLFNHSGYAGLTLKDSIADRFREKTGIRPSVNTANPDINVNLHISGVNVTVSLNSSGDPLFKRGYRQAFAEAPLNESLAAGMLLISGWNGTEPLIDPMCGSGTIPVEAALIARKIPPGRFRKSFGFQKWNNYDSNLFQQIKQECEAGIVDLKVRISGSDIAQEAVNNSIINIRNAGLENDIAVETADFNDITAPDNKGTLMINPPYGLRLNPADIDSLYAQTGTRLKHGFEGYTAWILSSNREALKRIGLKPSEKHVLMNGANECMFLKYDLYHGSQKNRNSIQS
ncbi:MAG: class I SAM-dependent RNA methyltransferase [Bacteroidales bacterium]|jgi:putative N6-adenine-specific DNA methylase|nr:class I SAM-dependent RNA methyltransferase [Bacteroidales bacterium]